MISFVFIPDTLESRVHVLGSTNLISHLYLQTLLEVFEFVGITCKWYQEAGVWDVFKAATLC